MKLQLKVKVSDVERISSNHISYHVKDVLTFTKTMLSGSNDDVVELYLKSKEDYNKAIEVLNL